MCIRQVATLLGYGEPQILEVFKNTLPILGVIPHRRSDTSSRNNKRNIDQRKDRQTICRSVISNSIYEYKG